MSMPMVQAILEGRKSQTRRVIKPQFKVAHEIFQYQGNTYIQTELLERNKNALNGCIKCPFGQVGSRLWVRETCQYPINRDGTPVERVIYKADLSDADANNDACDWSWKPSIFMPRWASRITLEITNIRVGRLQEITLSDCWDEGIAPEWGIGGKIRFRMLWDLINAKRGYSWESNPWCWCLSFKVVR